MEKMINMQNMPLNQIALILILSVAVGVTALTIAFDARDRGMSKFSAVMLGLAVQMFFPIAIIYCLVRMFTPAKTGARPFQGGRPAQPAQPEQHIYCPYCAAPVKGDTKICPGCGRLL